MSNAEALYIGVDLGTSATKLLLVDGDGAILNTVSKAYPVEFPHPGWSQQDPADWWGAVTTGIPELLAGANDSAGADPASVRAIACGGQMHGLVALDAAGEVIRPAILWNDGRTTAEVDYLNNTVGAERLAALTGNIAYAGFTAPKLLWMRANEPQLFARIAHVLLPKDYVTWRLTGEYATDVSDASGMLLLDVGVRRWSPQMLELCGLTEDQLPKVHESYEPVGTLRPDVARELGLSPNVIVAAGAGDNAAAAVGTGVTGSGSCNISLGTSGTVFIPTEGFAAGVGDRIHSFCHADGGWHVMGCILSAASCNSWWMQDVLGTDDFAGEQAGIDPARVAIDDPYYLPYLMGERTPHNDALARGTFTGLRMDTGRADMTRAVLEGVAFAIRDSLEIARGLGEPVRTSRVCGGGAKSRLWLQMLASACDVTLELPQTEQGPGYGAAMLAMVAAGDAPSVGECAARLTQVRDRVEPDPALTGIYQRRYAIWRGLYPALKDSFAAMGGMR